MAVALRTRRTEAMHDSGMFFVNEAIERQSEYVLACLDDQELLKATSQWMFEADIFRAATHHQRRTYNLSQAAFILFPFLPFISVHMPKSCRLPDGTRGKGWTGHDERLRMLRREMEAAGISKPAVLTCTCVMQHSLFDELYAWLQSRPNLVQLAHMERSKPASASDRVVVVPYHAGNESYSDDCRSDGSIYWAGSPSVANRNATIVRRWIVRLGKQNSSGKMRVFPSFRACGYKRDDRFCYNRACKGGACSESVSLKSMADCSRAVAANPRCGHSFSFGKDGWCDCVPPGKPCLPKRGAGYKFGQHAKGVMRREMAAAQFCLVPEGDSPDSSRVYDAVMQLCIPVLLRLWQRASVTVPARRFLSMGEQALQAEVRAQPVRCADLRALRKAITARSILARLAADVRWLMRPNASDDALPRFVVGHVG
ncbi:hypothetical protein EMIHUDRAFT_215578 [Emiliania huxleyi CCMP1516]|uniref:Exostosin GT47 domain-containing protein n=2 Tax=Emiliania huxleyi TaxID=2903 RepID=A0A0D3IGL8_EMIH1|nr:hypothetical protein EMIHUDRAFT_215578 [Emiliania huxleyi CCMP1516]EOD10403.1 hypothetical protein EMIHUDRAFT_215578 [Emiliania huxleyi CCMP1516]|eukprot:XP_005762832.1 hypothetical protein EMIHUDRAFT_215578 [Emiliania huxleyi CCMP1516]